LNIALDRQSLSTLNFRSRRNLIISFLLVVLIIYLFSAMPSLLSALIDIRFLMASFFIMYLCGFSINVLTMLGIVLATGLVVDDGIVVTENITRNWREV